MNAYAFASTFLFASFYFLVEWQMQKKLASKRTTTVMADKNIYTADKHDMTETEGYAGNRGLKEMAGDI